MKRFTLHHITDKGRHDITIHLLNFMNRLKPNQHVVWVKGFGGNKNPSYLEVIVENNKGD